MSARLDRVGLALVLIGAWELMARSAMTLLLPTVPATIGALARLLVSPDFWRALAVSHEALAGGFLVAALVGVPVGLALGRWPRVARWCDPYVDVLLVTPTSTIIPLVVLAAGLSVWSRSAVVSAFALPVIIVTAETGMRQTDVRLVDMARSFGATPWQILWRVRVPSARPAVLTGLRLGLARAFAGMVVSELVLMAAGLGGLILRFQADFDAAATYAVVLLVVVEAVALMRLARRIDERLAAWRPSGVPT